MTVKLDYKENIFIWSFKEKMSQFKTSKKAWYVGVHVFSFSVLSNAQNFSYFEKFVFVKDIM